MSLLWVSWPCWKGGGGSRVCACMYSVWLIVFVVFRVLPPRHARVWYVAGRSLCVTCEACSWIFSLCIYLSNLSVYLSICFCVSLFLSLWCFRRARESLLLNHHHSNNNECSTSVLYPRNGISLFFLLIYSISFFGVGG